MADAAMLLQWEEPAMVEGFRQVLAPTAATDREFILDCLQATGGALSRPALASKVATRLTNREFTDVMAGLQTEGRILQRKAPKALGKTSAPIVYYRSDMQDEYGNRIFQRPSPQQSPHQQQGRSKQANESQDDEGPDSSSHELS
jgi:hypothetical protein